MGESPHLWGRPAQFVWLACGVVISANCKEGEGRASHKVRRESGDEREMGKWGWFVGVGGCGRFCSVVVVLRKYHFIAEGGMVCAYVSVCVCECACIGEGKGGEERDKKGG